MDELIRILMLCLMGALMGLLLKGNSPIFTVLLLIALAIVAIRAFAPFYKSISEFINQLIYLSGISGEIFSPLIKTVAISIVTKISSDLCRDAGAAAAAGVAEMAGVLCAVVVAIPLMQAVIEMISSFI